MCASTTTSYILCYYLQGYSYSVELSEYTSSLDGYAFWGDEGGDRQTPTTQNHVP
jgi:hypothetical protein